MSRTPSEFGRSLGFTEEAEDVKALLMPGTESGRVAAIGFQLSRRAMARGLELATDEGAIFCVSFDRDTALRWAGLLSTMANAS